MGMGPVRLDSFQIRCRSNAHHATGKPLSCSMPPFVFIPTLDYYRPSQCPAKFPYVVTNYHKP